MEERLSRLESAVRRQRLTLIALTLTAAAAALVAMRQEPEPRPSQFSQRFLDAVLNDEPLHQVIEVNELRIVDRHGVVRACLRGDDRIVDLSMHGPAGELLVLGITPYGLGLHLVRDSSVVKEDGSFIDSSFAIPTSRE